MSDYPEYDNLTWSELSSKAKVLASGNNWIANIDRLNYIRKKLRISYLEDDQIEFIRKFYIASVEEYSPSTDDPRMIKVYKKLQKDIVDFIKNYEFSAKVDLDEF